MSLFLRKIGTSVLNARTSYVLTRSLCAATLDAKEVDKLVHNNKVVVFMKGNPDAPRCGFSNAVVQILRMHAVNYDSHDVLQSEALRQAIKDYSNWPTIPQIFINGEFVGGCDIMLQMHQNGELVDELKKAGITSALVDAAGAEEKK
ncbi:glutaredoxin-related protein 5, mitochondrial [Armigeres subalbatus]|uniref:glutaredoxin-related protein 5, mitochondrial n=1 Tax=Armigeres subalbatus TaxID=124917 RepID=UPI002ED2F91D